MVNWTPEQFKQYLEKRKAGGDKPVAELTKQRIATIRGKGNQGDARINKTESEYLRILETRKAAGEFTLIRYNQLKFRVAGLKCHLSPDFSCVRPDGKIEIHEVKGDWVYEDSRVKFLSCAEKYSEFIWVWAQKKRKIGWVIKTVEPAIKT